MTKRQRRMMIIGVAGALALGGLVFFTTHYSPLTTHQSVAKASYYCPMHPTYTSDRPGDCPICNMKLVKRDAEPEPEAKKLLYWTDPMIPGYKSDKPGKSPMGMDLVPVYEEAAPMETRGDAPAGYTPITLTTQKQQLIGVKTAPAERRAMVKTIRTAGRIAYDPELYQAEQEYLQALSGLLEAYASPNPEITAQAQRLIGASRTRLRLMGLSEAFIGTMTSWAGPDQRLLGTDPSGEVWLYAPIYEFELPLVQVGQTVSVEIPTMPGQPLEGTIRTMDPILDPATRAAKIRAVLQNPGGALKPEMYVNASIRVDLGELLAVPEAAVFATGTRSLIFVERGEGVFEPREVTLGAKADDWQAVTAGLEEGERVVTSGNFLIDSESRLKAALQGAGGETHQHGP